jgi:hypothetical protein
VINDNSDEPAASNCRIKFPNIKLSFFADSLTMGFTEMSHAPAAVRAIVQILFTEN